MLDGSGLGAYVCDGAFHGDIYLVCAWQLLQRLILKCAEVGGTDRWVPRQLIFIQRAWPLPGATCDLRHWVLCDACILFPERSTPCPWLVSMVRGRVGPWPPDSSFCGLSTAPTCVSVLHVDAEPFCHGHSLQPCWLVLFL